MKKKIICIIVVILLIALAFLYLSYNSQPSKSEIANILEKENQIPNNVYIKEEMLDNANITHITEIYKKDNVIYEHYQNDDATENQDILWNLTTNEITLIDNFDKTITITPTQETSPVDEYLQSFNTLLNETKDKFKYYGEEDVNGKNCVKFSLEDSELGYITYYYVGIEDKILYKKEEGNYVHKEFMPLYTHTYTYSYDTVTDDDILTFDISNYNGYTILSSSSKNVETEMDTSYIEDTSILNAFEKLGVELD